MTSADQGCNDRYTDNEGEDESVDAVPSWGPARLCSLDVGVVEEGESEELGDETDFGAQEKGWPGDRGSYDTDGISRITLLTTEFGPFETPVNSTEERNDLSLISMK